MVETEFDKACQRCDEAVNKEQAYLDLIEKNGEELRTLEDRDNDAAEREFETEEKLRFVICLFIGAVSHFTNILLLYFLAILRISCRFSLIKAHKLHYFYFLLYARATDVRRNHCNSNGYIPPRFLQSPCFKYIVHQINSFALIVA